MKDLPSYDKIVELVDGIVSREDEPLMDFIEIDDEFVGPITMSKYNKIIINKLFDEGYPVGFASQSPESYKFRIYKIGAETPSAFHLIIDKNKIR